MKQVLLIFLLISLTLPFAQAQDDDKPMDERKDDRGMMGDEQDKREGKDDFPKELEDRLRHLEQEARWIEMELPEAAQESRRFLDEMKRIREKQIKLIQEILKSEKPVMKEREGLVFDELQRMEHDYMLARTQYMWKKETEKLRMFIRDTGNEEAEKLIKDLDKVYKKKIKNLEKMKRMILSLIEDEKEIRKVREKIDMVVGK